MPLWFLPALLGFFVCISLGAGLWLLLHSRDVARTFSGRREGEPVPGPGKKRASRRAIWLGLIVFNVGWIASLLIWIFTMTGEANQVVNASA